MLINVGLRVDVDTCSGTRDGVPRLLKTFKAYGIKATFFFSVGPDNMGRHVWRLIRPTFLMKMLRSKAASLYSWDIFLRGVFWPGPVIGNRFADVITATAAAGHEIGLHAWDHHRWQMHVYKMTAAEIHEALHRGVQSLSRILGAPPRCSAAAGWRCSDAALLEKEKFEFDYNSDCRGSGIFLPIIDGTQCLPQVPVTLPTYDEVIGHNGIDDSNYNEYLLAKITGEQLNVLTVHAEVEGVSRNGLFRQFLELARTRNIRFVPLEQLVRGAGTIKSDTIVQRKLPGRDGQVCWQASAAEVAGDRP